MARKCNVYTPKGTCMTGDLSTDYATSMVDTNVDGSFTNFIGSDETITHPVQTSGNIKIISDVDGKKNGTGVDRLKDKNSKFYEKLLTPITFDFNTVTNCNGGNYLNQENCTIENITYSTQFNKNIITELKTLLTEANKLRINGKQFAVHGNDQYKPFSIYRYSTVNSDKKPKDKWNLSWHTYGVAIDFSHIHNPQTTTDMGHYCPICGEIQGDDWLHIRTENHPLVQLFYKNPIGGCNWRWGGIWNEHDYMHFDFGV